MRCEPILYQVQDLFSLVLHKHSNCFFLLRLSPHMNWPHTWLHPLFVSLLFFLSSAFYLFLFENKSIPLQQVAAMVIAMCAMCFK